MGKLFVRSYYEVLKASLKIFVGESYDIIIYKLLVVFASILIEKIYVLQTESLPFTL